MAKKYWEKLSNKRLQFYDAPQDLRDTDLDARIADLQTLLALPAEVKALLAGAMPAVADEAAFDALFQDELELKLDIRDFMHGQTVTVLEQIDVVDYRWMSPADLAGGMAAVESVCGEEAGNPAAQAINGVNGDNWQHDLDHPHEIVIDLGYKKRIDGIRIALPTSSPGTPFILRDVQVHLANGVAGLDNPESHVGVDLEFADAGDNDRALTSHVGRYLRLQIGSTDHHSNHITVRDIYLRTRVRTFGEV